jgi:predicted CoA-binding protein
MASKATIESFIAERTLAIVGVSRTGRKFGNTVLRELSAKGYTVFPVHPEATEIGGRVAYRSLAALPAKVGGVVIIVPPAQTQQVVRDAHAAGIRRVWLQQGAGSADAVRYCEANGIGVVDGECILMFASPSAWIHRAHRWVWGVLGRLPN